MPKKLLSLLAAFCLLVCLSACRKTNDNAKSALFETQISSTQSTNRGPTETNANNNKPSSSGNKSEKDSHQTQLPTTQSKSTETTTTSAHIHSYSNATCTTPKTCTCGATIGTPIGHHYSEATCTTPKICTYCNTEVSKPLGHAWKEATCDNPKLCQRCNLTDGVSLGHDYNKEHICIRCNSIDPLFVPISLSKMEAYKKDGNDWLKYQDSALDIFGTTHNDVIFAETITSNASVDYTYRIDQRYEKITGTVFLQKGAIIPNGGYTGSMKIYGDGKLLYSVDIPDGFETTTFSLDISNIKDLRIYLHDGGLYGPAGRGLSNVLLHPVQ